MGGRSREFGLGGWPAALRLWRTIIEPSTAATRDPRRRQLAIGGWVAISLLVMMVYYSARSLLLVHQRVGELRDAPVIDELGDAPTAGLVAVNGSLAVTPGADVEQPLLWENQVQASGAADRPGAWTTSEATHPAFALDVGDELVTVTGDYLTGPLPVLSTGSTKYGKATRTVGLGPGDRVTVVGKLSATGGAATLTAELVLSDLGEFTKQMQQAETAAGMFLAVPLLVLLVFLGIVLGGLRGKVELAPEALDDLETS